MIPVRLTLQGIYSYQNTPQTIEFGPLLEAGNFGIFGAVGSGKSTILEAITMALYGETERLNKRDDRNYNMMNLKSDRLIVEFEFRNYEGVLYRFECDGRRNSKQFNEVNTYRRRASVWKDEEWTPLDHTDGEKVTGISYENFKRTVIIPQGHFQEFLELTPGARSQMLQDLFSLDRFDLAGATIQLSGQSSEAIHRIEGQLTGYEDVTPENIVHARTEFNQLKEKLIAQSKMFDQLKAKAEASSDLKQLFDQLKERQSAYQQLKEKEDGIQKSSIRLKMYQEARENFALRFSQIDSLRSSVARIERELKEWTSKAEMLKIEREKIVENYRLLNQTVEQHPSEINKAREYTTAAKLLNLRKDEEVANERIRKGMTVVEDLRNNLSGKEGEITDLDAKIGEYRQKTGDRELLVELKNLFQRKTELLAQQFKLQERMEQADLKIKEEIALFVKHYQLDDSEELELPDSSVLDARLNDVKKKIEDQRKLFDHLNVQAGLAQYVAQLSPGESCPLCGSTEHPAPAHIDFAQTQIDEAKRKIGNLEQEQQNIEKGKVEWKNLSGNLRQRREQRTQEEKEVRELTEALRKVESTLMVHQNNYPNEGEVQSAISVSNEVLEVIKNTEQRLKLVQKEWKNDTKNLEVYRKKIEEIKSVGDLLKGEIKSLESHLSEEIKLDLHRHSQEEWKELSQKLSQRMEKEKEEYRKVAKSRDRVLEEYTQLETRIKGSQSYLAKEVEKLDKEEKYLNSILAKSSFESFSAIREILSNEIDIETEQNRIEEYNRQIHVLEVALKDLKNQIADRKFDEKAHSELIGQLETTEKEWGELRERMAYHSRKLEESEKRLETKRKLEADHEGLQIRAGNLKVLESLFRGKKFVDYVSTVYLREICEIANRRFRKLTNNHYSLILGEDNQFNVRDYIHDGQIRSVKTLSGGQIFQVSLCLALALAESIQKRSKTSQNFFFLDEGFGTLDGDALRLVLEALKTLRQEDRVVGVISHVESLQNEMEMYLLIYNDPEKGSQIRRSWDMNPIR